MKLSLCLLAILAICPYEIAGNLDFGISSVLEMLKGYMESSKMKKKMQVLNLQPIINDMQKGDMTAKETLSYLKKFKREANYLLKLRDEVLENKAVNDHSPELKAFAESFDDSTKYYQAHLKDMPKESLDVNYVVEYFKSLLKVRDNFENFVNTVKLDSITGSLMY